MVLPESPDITSARVMGTELGRESRMAKLDMSPPLCLDVVLAFGWGELERNLRNCFVYLFTLGRTSLQSY